jgi:hypothetical protein
MVAAGTEGSKIWTFGPKSGVFDVGRVAGGVLGVLGGALGAAGGVLGLLGALGVLGVLGGVLGVLGVLGVVGVLGEVGVLGVDAVPPDDPAADEPPPHPTNTRHKLPAMTETPADTGLKLRMPTR